MFSIGNEELEKAPDLLNLVRRRSTGEIFNVSTSFSEGDALSIQTIKEKEELYLVGINGKLIDIEKWEIIYDG